MGRILVVDDEKSIRVTLSEFLRDDGHEVRVAEDVMAATELMAREEFDLVVTDIILPRVSGVELLKAIRESSPHSLVIMMTGEPTVETAAESVRAGAFDYLAKPITKHIALKSVRNALKVKELNDEKQRLEAENRRYQQDLEQLVENRTATLRESEGRLQSIFDSIFSGVVIIDTETREIVDLNPVAVELIGIPKEEIIGRICHDFICPTEKGRCPILDLGEDVDRSERVLLNADGAKVPILKTATVTTIGGKKCLIDSFVDLTASKKAEAEKAEIEVRFHQAQKMESVGRLAGGVAHDFNNLLTVILMSCSLMVKDLREGDPLLEDVRQIESAGKRAESLTRQLLAFSRKQLLQTEVLDLNQTLENLDKMLRRLIGEDIDIATEMDPSVWKVEADPGQIEQIVLNLAVNARDAMPTGGKLTMETANVELDEEYARNHIDITPGPYVMLAVSDTGCGMDAETVAQIFDPFFTTKEKGKGTGLGLSTVYGIVKQHGGNIWVDSEPGKGTTFKIYLPRAKTTEMTVTKDRETVKDSRGTETVLMVEDAKAVLRIGVRVLESEGYKVLQARDGLEGQTVANAYEGPIHLLLTDVVMPRSSGKELAVKLLATRPELKVLYMSGYTDDAIAHQGVLDKGTHLVQKPFSVDSLAKKVREALDHEGDGPG